MTNEGGIGYHESKFYNQKKIADAIIKAKKPFNYQWLLWAIIVINLFLIWWMI